jgi:hypothetical protein
LVYGSFDESVMSGDLLDRSSLSRAWREGVVGVRRHALGFWIVGVFAIALAGLFVDQTTGDTTGPPYHDSLMNQVAFFVFFGATVVFLGLCVFALAGWTRRRRSHGPED